MYPFLHLGSFDLGTFGLFLWLAAVCAGVVLYRSFKRDGVDADALSIVTAVTLAGVLGAKLWHELQDVPELQQTMHAIFLPGWSHPGEILVGLGQWMRTGIAWFGGLLAGIAMLLWQGRQVQPNGLTGWRGAVRMLDLAAPAVPIGYGVGRLGCLMSGDGDYGRNTTSAFWGVHMAPDALVRPTPTDALVLNTPLWEFLIGLVLALVIWRLGARARPLGFVTGAYLALSGLARFAVEFWRINPKNYWGMSNAQVAALLTVVAGLVIVLSVRRHTPMGGPAAAIVPIDSTSAGPS